MTYALIDTNMPREMRESLTKLSGAKLLSLPRNTRLQAPVASHPDMRIFILGNKFFISRSEADELDGIVNSLTSLGLRAVLCNTELSEKYPHDIAFNCFRVGSFLFGRLDFIASEIIAEAEHLGLTLISVKQGYAKCSTVIVSDNAIITADPSIANTAASYGIDILRVSVGGVELPGYDCGFIGGASGVLDDTVYFCGSLDTHPDKEAIKNFCEKHKKAAVSLGDGRLLDIGSILFV